MNEGNRVSHASFADVSDDMEFIEEEIVECHEDETPSSDFYYRSFDSCSNNTGNVMPGTGIQSSYYLPSTGIQSSYILPSTGVQSSYVLPSTGIQSTYEGGRQIPRAKKRQANATVTNDVEAAKRAKMQSHTSNTSRYYGPEQSGNCYVHGNAPINMNTQFIDPGYDQEQDYDDQAYDPEDHDLDIVSTAYDNVQSNEDFDNFVDLQYGDIDTKCITFDPIEEILAGKVDCLCTKQPMLQKLDKISENYNRPENVKYLLMPKVNPELWCTMSKFHRSRDLSLQSCQKYLVYGMSAVTQLLNDIYSARKNKTSFDLKQAQEKAYDALSFLGYSQYELNMKRREFLKPSVHP